MAHDQFSLNVKVVKTYNEVSILKKHYVLSVSLGTNVSYWS